ncbi:MAG: deoxynucleoside kinase [Proteobacteria bacterium]|nr:deoxynucleoside kinase [Pseudomonadota bacterium]
MGYYVVIEGLIGVGKTTLARLVASHLDGRLSLEPNERNPFLEPFYRNPDRYAFPVQMFYLATRWRQQELIKQGDLFNDTIVSDYVFAKDRIFAEKTLNSLELDLYDRFAGALCDKAPTPDLVVFLRAPVDVLMQRIAERQAPGECAITVEYLVDLERRYELLFADWDACPLLVIDNRDMDYRGDSKARKTVLERIQAALSGRHTTTKAPGSIADREAQPELFGVGGV